MKNGGHPEKVFVAKKDIKPKLTQLCVFVCVCVCLCVNVQTYSKHKSNF